MSMMIARNRKKGIAIIKNSDRKPNIKQKKRSK